VENCVESNEHNTSPQNCKSTFILKQEDFLITQTSQLKKPHKIQRSTIRKNNTLISLPNHSIIMTSTTQKGRNGAGLASTKFVMSEASIKWDQAEKGFLTDAERIAKNMDVDGKGHLSREQSVSLGSQFHSLKEDNKQIKKQLYGLAILCVLLFIGTIAGTVMAIKNGKDTVVDTRTGLMKVKNGSDGVDVVTVKAQGTTFQTTGSVMTKEETTTDGETFTKLVVGHCVSSEDIASMWLANEQGTDARLVFSDEVNDNGTGDTDTDTGTSSIEPVTTGRASWNQDHIVMGGMTFIPNEDCTDVNGRRKLLESNGIENADTPSFDSVAVHRALKKRVDFLSGRRLNYAILANDPSSYSNYAVLDWAMTSVVPEPVNLLSTKNYVIFAKAGITNVVKSTIVGDMAVSPIAASAITGFVLAMETFNTYSTDTNQITGRVYAPTYAGDTASILTIAATDMTTAYNDASARVASGGAYENVRAGAIGGLDFGPGVYTFSTGISITSDIKFSGTATDIFIMKTAGSISQAAGTRVVLGGNARAENIFWAVAGTVSVGAGSHMKGTLLVATTVTFITDSSLEGRILSQTAVALQMATIKESQSE
jgi:hypothetical protein